MVMHRLLLATPFPFLTKVNLTFPGGKLPVSPHRWKPMLTYDRKSLGQTLDKQHAISFTHMFSLYLSAVQNQNTYQV